MKTLAKIDQNLRTLRHQKLYEDNESYQHCIITLLSLRGQISGITYDPDTKTKIQVLLSVIQMLYNVAGNYLNIDTNETEKEVLLVMKWIRSIYREYNWPIPAYRPAKRDAAKYVNPKKHLADLIKIHSITDFTSLLPDEDEDVLLQTDNDDMPYCIVERANIERKLASPCSEVYGNFAHQFLSKSLKDVSSSYDQWHPDCRLVDDQATSELSLNSPNLQSDFASLEQQRPKSANSTTSSYLLRSLLERQESSLGEVKRKPSLSLIDLRPSFIAATSQHLGLVMALEKSRTHEHVSLLKKMNISRSASEGLHRNTPNFSILASTLSSPYISRTPSPITPKRKIASAATISTTNKQALSTSRSSFPRRRNSIPYRPNNLDLGTSLLISQLKPSCTHPSQDTKPITPCRPNTPILRGKGKLLKSALKSSDKPKGMLYSDIATVHLHPDQPMYANSFRPKLKRKKLRIITNRPSGRPSSDLVVTKMSINKGIYPVKHDMRQFSPKFPHTSSIKPSTSYYLTAPAPTPSNLSHQNTL